MFCPNCGFELQGDHSYCPNCGNPVQPKETSPAWPMGWYKFLIYFSLFASAFFNLCTAIGYMTGLVYEESAELVYAAFPSLRTLDFLYAIALILFAAYCLYTRFRLADFKKNGPACLLAIYVISAAIPLIYALAAASVLPEMGDVVSSAAGGLLPNVVLFLINRTYFKHRQHLFVH